MVSKWIRASRPRTLTLSFSGILMGTVLASRFVGINYSIMLLTFFTSFCLQILSNFANDLGDSISGVDSGVRKGPTRTIQAGNISRHQMKMVIVAFSIISFVSGITLIFISFPNNFLYVLIFFLLGVLSIYVAIKYTMGKNPYGYVGFGDLFVFVFFGIVSVIGTSFLQMKIIESSFLFPAISLGLFSVGVLNLNNIRDIESDGLSRKKSIPVRIGLNKSRIYHASLLLLGMMMSLLYVFIYFKDWKSCLFLFSYIFFTKNIMMTFKKEGKKLDKELEKLAISILFYTFLFIIGLI